MKLLDGRRFFVISLIIGLILGIVVLKSDVYFQVSFGFKVSPSPYVIELEPTNTCLKRRS